MSREYPVPIKTSWPSECQRLCDIFSSFNCLADAPVDRFCPSIDLNRRVALGIPAATQHGTSNFTRQMTRNVRQPMNKRAWVRFWHDLAHLLGENFWGASSRSGL
jgi:hypothetical protein